MVQINNDTRNDKPVPYGVEALRCLKDNKSTSLENNASGCVMQLLLVRFKGF